MINEEMANFYGDFAHLMKNQTIDGAYFVYKLNEKYGTGTIILCKILDGAYIGLHNYKFLKNIDAQKTAYTDLPSYRETLLVQYCIQGHLVSNLKDGLSCTIAKGETLFFAGSGTLESMIAIEPSIRGIVVLCERGAFTDSLATALLIKPKDVTDYFSNISGQPFVVKTNRYNAEIISELQSYIEDNEIPMIRIRGLELLYDIIKNHEDYKNSSKGGYKKELINRIVSVEEYISANPESNYTLPELALKFGVSETYLKAVFKYVYKVSVAAYASQNRLEYAKRLLLETDLSITVIAGKIGYANQSKFSRAFKKQFNQLPSAYRRDNKN